MEKENSTPLDRMRHIEKALDEYEVKIGLPKFIEDKVDENVKSYLNISREQMEKMSPEDCSQASILLVGYSFHLQRALNRETARINWAESVLRDIVCGKENQYRGSWDSQFNQAIKNDDYARGVLKLKNYAQQRADRITFLATSVKNLGEAFKNLQIAKGMK